MGKAAWLAGFWLCSTAVAAPGIAPSFDGAEFRLNLAYRNLMDDLRSAGATTGGPPAFTAKDRSAFLEKLDQTIRRLQRPR